MQGNKEIKLISKKQAIFAFVILIVGLIGISGYYFWKKEKPKTTSEITEWETYKNEKYGYSLKYPKGWKIQKNSTSVGFVPTEFYKKQAAVPGFWVMIKLNPDNLEVKDWIEQENEKFYKYQDNVSKTEFSELVIDNQKCLVNYSDSETISIPESEIFCSKNNKIYHLSFSFNAAKKDMVIEIAKSFKF